MRTSAALLLAFTFSAAAEEKVSLEVINRIKTEAFQNSQVMDHLFYLSDVYGPRLTNSPGHRAAADFVVKRLTEYGLTNVRLEKWGPFGESWKCTRFTASMLEPGFSPLIGMPLAWTPGTNGPARGEPVLAVITNESDFAKYKGKLKGKIVLTMEPKQVLPITEPLSRRWTEAELEDRANNIDLTGRGMFGPPAAPAGRAGGGGGRRAAAPAAPADRNAAARFRNNFNQFLKDEGALVVLQYGYNGDGGTVFASAGGSRDPKDPVPPPMVAVTPEHYNRIARLIEKKIPTTLEFDIQSQFLNDMTDSFNVTGEIVGGAKKDEVVMLGGHLDSWHGGTGATDNGTGSSVAIEAVRILKTLKVPMDRTVRIALWSGEEQGLLGSIAYVQEHFAKHDIMEKKPEYAKLSAYYNDDSGTGKFRGISTGGNDMVKPIFEAWLAPFHDLGATVVIGGAGVANRAPGGTDHTSFTWIGLPGFGFLQDQIEYQTRTHHSNMDVFDRVQAGDVMQASAIMASFVYHTATRPEMMPRVAPPMPAK
jgi:hypothetical protein